MLKKSLTPLHVGEKISNSKGLAKKLLPQLNHPYPPPPQTSDGHVNHLEVGGRNGFDTLVNVIHHRALIMWWFSRLKFCISRLKIRRSKTQMERESSKECSVSFLWTNDTVLSLTQY